MLIFETYGGLIMPRRAQEVVCTEEELKVNRPIGTFIPEMDFGP